MKPGCATRNHRWDTPDRKGKPGAKCLDCPQVFGERKRRSASTEPETVQADYIPPPSRPATGINETLRAKWGLGNQPQQPAQPTQEAQPAQKEAQGEETEKVDLTDLLSEEFLPDLIVGGEQKIIKVVMKTEPAEPFEPLKEKFDESFGKLGKTKMPRIMLSPGMSCLLLGLAMLGQMWWQGKPIPRKPKDSAPTGPSADGTDANPGSDQPTPSSPQTPRLSLVEGSGTANGADNSSSDD